MKKICTFSRPLKGFMVEINSWGKIRPFLQFCRRPWSSCGGWAKPPRHFTPGSPRCVPAPSMGPLCRSKPTHRAGHTKTRREGVETSTQSWPQWHLHFYLITSRATTVVQSHVDHFLAVCSHIDQQRSSPGVSGPAFAHQTIPQSRGNTSFTAELTVRPRCIALATQWTLMRARDLANRVDFLWVRQTICCELYLLGNYLWLQPPPGFSVLPGWLR